MTEDLSPRIYDELRTLAAGYLRGRPDHTLQPTALVHEAWVKLARADSLQLSDRQHFLALAATVMRQLLIDHAREKGAVKRGGGWERVTLGEGIRDETTIEVDFLALDEALGRLARLNPDRARLVELRYFAGATLEEAAACLGISRSEAARRWKFVKTWLGRELRDEEVV